MNDKILIYSVAGAKMMYYLDQTQKEKALSLATQIPGEILGTQHEVP